MSQEAGKVYVAAVNKEIKITDKKKKDFLNILKINIENFLLENVGAGYEEIVDNFGTPEEVAESYWDSLGNEEIIAKVKSKRKIVIAILVIGIILVATVGGIVGHYYYLLTKELPVYTVEEIEILDTWEE